MFTDAFTNKTILITGGTGSFGNKLLENLIDSDVKEIRIFSRDELKQETMRLNYKNPKIRFFIGDVRNKPSLQAAMRGSNLVFHAAALKQVPTCEFFPLEAVQTNIIGSNNVFESASEYGIEKVICLSTDKAVQPVNAMGMSKALMEKVALATARMSKDGLTTIARVRYGNVMYSRGSVIPLLVNQIIEGKPLTLTNIEMTRFLMSLQSAIDLVLFALENAANGDLFIRKAPAASIDTLAKALKSIFNSNNEVQILGSRHGEKMYEVLATSEELNSSIDMGNYFRVYMDTRDLNYTVNEYTAKVATYSDDYTSNNTEQLTVGQLEEILIGLPEIKEIMNGKAKSDS